MSLVPLGNVIPLVQPEDVDLGKDIREKIWLLDASWIRFVSVVMLAREDPERPLADILIGIDLSCPHEEREVQDVIFKLLREGWDKETIDAQVTVRRGSAR